MQPLNLCYCGGEPLLRKEILLKSAKILKANNPFGMISMVTNGLLIDEKNVSELLESGVTRIQVSLDGATSTTHDKLRQKKGAFDSAINAIKILKQKKVDSVEIAFCPTSFNLHEFLDVYNICKKLNVDGIRVQPLMLLGRANNNSTDIVPSEEQYRQLVETIYNIQKNDKSITVTWGDPVDHIIRFKTVCRSFISFIGIKANGSIAPSPYIPFVVGNIRKYKLSDYWEAGLARMWEIEDLVKLANRISSVSDYCKNEAGVPVVFKEPDLIYDIIEAGCFS